MMNSMKQKIFNMFVTLFAMVLLIALSGMQVFAAVDEDEPNDTVSNANVIKIGETVYGVSDNFYSEGSSGEDWFRLTAPVSGTGKITVYADEKVTRFGEAAVEVYDRNMNELASAYDDVDTESGETATFGVQSGKNYYIRAYGSNCGFFLEDVSYHFSTGYSIGKTTISSVKGKKKKFTVKWNKKAKASFYQIQYVKKSVYDDYGWRKAKTIKVSKSYNSKTIKKLAKKKKYCVRVRVVRKIAGKTYYSGWSKRKTVKTK